MIQAHQARSAAHPLNPSDEPGLFERYVYLLQSVSSFLSTDSLHELIPARSRSSSFSPLIETERLALEFLSRGGKRFRPFVTLAAYDALTGGPGATRPELFPEAVRRSVVAVEAFHKASLVHDDIEDDDLYRYGFETLHRQHGIATAINVGDYLVGLGYRWITSTREEIGPECAADILHRLMDAHVRLSEGQGAELAWRKTPTDALTEEDALAIYELKTSPAFEAALYVGIRLAGPALSLDASLVRFAQQIGTGFQIRNDLLDWLGDPENKVVKGQDASALRPTILLAWALEEASSADREKIYASFKTDARDPQTGSYLSQIYADLGLAERAERLIDRFRAGALAASQSIEHAGLSTLLSFLTSRILPPRESAD